jgi:heme exporter protein D
MSDLGIDLDAGKYAAYVWPAFAATLLGFAWMIGDSLIRARTWRRKAQAARNTSPSDGRD